MLMLGAVTCLAGGLVFAVNLVGHWIPRSVPPGATLFALVLTGYGRATWRRLAERDRRASGGAGEATRVLVVGAGDAGRDLLGSMRQDPIHRWEPVGLLDDDPRKRHLRLRGVPVLGPTDKLAVEVERTGASTVVLALPSADADTIARLRLDAVDAGASVKVLPATTELLHERVGIQDLRDINLTAARYYTNAEIDAPEEKIAPNFFKDTWLNTLGYDRGALYFAILNGKIGVDALWSISDRALASNQRAEAVAARK